MTESRPSTPPTDLSAPRPRRILVADDEHLIATTLAGNLRDLGFDVLGPAPDGEMAVTLGRQDPPDLAILDIRMPTLDGLAAAGILFGELRVPVILLSGYSEPEEVSAGCDRGVFGYLIKPATKDQIRVMIDVVWSRFCDWSNLDRESRELHRRLEQRKTIEQAKWILVKRKSVEEPEAMRLLQQQARNNRRALIDVAQAVIDSDSLLGD